MLGICLPQSTTKVCIGTTAVQQQMNGTEGENIYVKIFKQGYFRVVCFHLTPKPTLSLIYPLHDSIHSAFSYPQSSNKLTLKFIQTPYSNTILSRMSPPFLPWLLTEHLAKQVLSLHCCTLMDAFEALSNLSAAAQLSWLCQVI